MAAKFIETHLTCAICKDEFKEPHGLRCMHSFCLECLREHIQSNVKTKGKKKKKKPPGIYCPECRLFVEIPDPTQPREVWAEQFPVAFALKNIQGEIQSGDVVLSETNHGDGSKEDKVADESSAKGTPSQLREADWNTTTNTDRGDKKQDRKATRKMTGSFHKVIPLQPDKTQPDANDLAVLVQGDKKLIVVPDYANHKLLLLTLNIDMEVAQRSKYDLGAKPWRICEVEQNQVAVTVSEPSGL
ncbi:tripartite motif-containing protein 59-like [Haliotis rubra]|uniref:tripartite motif-containing protein 59-like n=1 Tax=Haliotis rubra TaxID=36100 RepID=UPI001EE601BD|nr:tripartite motif-containing protein 59-like [Haliotis rubra]